MSPWLPDSHHHLRDGDGSAHDAYRGPHRNQLHLAHLQRHPRHHRPQETSSPP